MGELYQLQVSLLVTRRAHQASFSRCYGLRLLLTAPLSPSVFALEHIEFEIHVYCSTRNHDLRM